MTYCSILIRNLLSQIKRKKNRPSNEANIKVESGNDEKSEINEEREWKEEEEKEQPSNGDVFIWFYL